MERVSWWITSDNDTASTWILHLKLEKPSNMVNIKVSAFNLEVNFEVVFSFINNISKCQYDNIKTLVGIYYNAFILIGCAQCFPGLFKATLQLINFRYMINWVLRFADFFSCPWTLLEKLVVYVNNTTFDEIWERPTVYS